MHRAIRTMREGGNCGDPLKRASSRCALRIAERNPPTPVERQRHPRAGFDWLEWQVIALARNDSLASILPVSRIARLSHWLFGGHREASLANPRLEALRCAAVIAWRNGVDLPRSVEATLSGAGFSPDQCKLLLARVTEACPPSKGNGVGPLRRFPQPGRDADPDELPNPTL